MNLIWGQCLFDQIKCLEHNTTSNLIDLKYILKGTKVTTKVIVKVFFKSDLLVIWDSLHSVFFFSPFSTGSEKLTETHLFVTPRLEDLPKSFI